MTGERPGVKAAQFTPMEGWMGVAHACACGPSRRGTRRRFREAVPEAVIWPTDPQGGVRGTGLGLTVVSFGFAFFAFGVAFFAFGVTLFLFELAEDGGLFAGVAGGDAFAESGDAEELVVEAAAFGSVCVVQIFLDVLGERDALHALVDVHECLEFITAGRKRGELGGEVFAEGCEGLGDGFEHGRSKAGTKG